MSKYTPKKQHAPIDDEVVIPAAIRAASARSEQLHKAAYEAQPEPKEPASPPVEVVQPEPKAPEDGTIRQSEEAAPKTPEQKAAEPPAPAAPKEEPKIDWEQRYNAMKGRYDQQVHTISTLTSRMGEMENLVARMRDEPAPKQPAPAELTFKPIGAEERETYGEDFIDVAKRAAMEGLNPEVSRLNGEIRKLQNQLGSLANTTASQQKQNIYTFLDGKIANWREVNRNPEFIAWASLSDPFSGVTRMEMLRDAFNKGDGPRVVNFFQGFLNDEAVTGPATIKSEIPDNSGKVPLESLAAPGRAKAPAASHLQAPGEKETITRAQIANFYRMKAQGHWRGNPEEAAALEARIFAAEQEGRIV